LSVCNCRSYIDSVSAILVKNIVNSRANNDVKFYRSGRASFHVHAIFLIRFRSKCAAHPTRLIAHSDTNWYTSSFSSVSVKKSLNSTCARHVMDSCVPVILLETVRPCPTIQSLSLSVIGLLVYRSAAYRSTTLDQPVTLECSCFDQPFNHRNSRSAQHNSSAQRIQYITPKFALKVTCTSFRKKADFERFPPITFQP